MTDQELKRLRRVELLDIMLDLQTKLDSARQENASLRQELERREIKAAEAGSIAQAALLLNGVFEAAQAAADDYLGEIQQRQKALQDQRDEIVAQAHAQAEELLKQAQRECEALRQHTWELCQAERQKVQQMELIFEDSYQ